VQNGSGIFPEAKVRSHRRATEDGRFGKTCLTEPALDPIFFSSKKEPLCSDTKIPATHASPKQAWDGIAPPKADGIRYAPLPIRKLKDKVNQFTTRKKL
jgi:hypothetical protein